MGVVVGRGEQWVVSEGVVLDSGDMKWRQLRLVVGM